MLTRNSMDKRKFILDIAQGKTLEESKLRIYEVVEGGRILKGEFDSDFSLDVEVISRREDVCQRG